MTKEFNLNCPVPKNDHATVQMAHGGGGRLMKNLIEEIFLPAFRGRAADVTVGPGPQGQLAAEAASPPSPA